MWEGLHEQTGGACCSGGRQSRTHLRHRRGILCPRLVILNAVESIQAGTWGDTPMLSEHQMILRLVVAAVLGSIVGIERERLNWVAGLRTHMLVCVGSALFMIVSFCGFADVLTQEPVRLDPSRIAAQVVSGIGFLGAGTIVLRSKVVRGLTTAASLWTVAAVGLAVGGGLYVAAATTTGLIVLILAGIKPMERRLFRARRRQTPLLILIIDRRETSLFAIEAVLEAANLPLQRMLIQHGKDPDEDRLQITVDRTRKTNVLSVTEQLRRIPGVREISHTLS
jgi:putative Mg2+ transporter-C (MgtC) family protein